MKNLHAVETPVACYSTEFKRWFRFEIINILEESQVNLFLTDFGILEPLKYGIVFVNVSRILSINL
jgi:hypothetical protein